MVVIVADDLGSNDVGFHNPKVKTPHLNPLVNDGVRLDRHDSDPICRYTREALLTGMSTSRTRMTISSGHGVFDLMVPQPGHSGGDRLRSVQEYGDKTGDFLGSPGYIRVGVSSDEMVVDYIRTTLPVDETPSQQNGRVGDSFVQDRKRRR